MKSFKNFLMEKNLEETFVAAALTGIQAADAAMKKKKENEGALEELPSQFSPTEITPGRKSPVHMDPNAYDPSLEAPTVAETPRPPYPSRRKKVPQVNPMNLDPTMEELPPMNPEKERRSSQL